MKRCEAGDVVSGWRKMLKKRKKGKELKGGVLDQFSERVEGDVIVE
jgi:hypothetical protein